MQKAAQCEQPVFFQGRGSVVDLKMILPAMADYSVVDAEASLGFPSARRQGPGVAAQAALRRVARHRVRRWVLLGERLDASAGLRANLIDAVAASFDGSDSITETLVRAPTRRWRAPRCARVAGHPKAAVEPHGSSLKWS